MKLLKNNVVRGTFILMIAGLLTRFLGFYYRIFLSSKIGAEGIGLYQMIFPIYGLCLSLCVSGIQSAITRFVSKDEKNSIKTLIAGLLIAIPLSLLCFLAVYFGSDFISTYYLNEPRCSILLKYASISLPMAVVHSCINSYFLGKKNASVPGITQFGEQFFRVVAIWGIFFIIDDSLKGNIVTLATIAVLGLAIGEISSMLISFFAVFINVKKSKSLNKEISTTIITQRIPYIARMAFPLTLTCLSLSIVHSIEATAIPFFLHKYGLSTSEAISTYGVLTAMAMPFIMFPTTVTGAISRMLMPVIASTQSQRNYSRITTMSINTIKYSFIFGFLCTFFFLATGKYIGNLFFNNTLAGEFITVLSWLCPFLFATGILGSILSGLGLTKAIFYHHLVSSLVRLLFVVITIPYFGILGYLWGILAGEVICAILHTISVLKYISKHNK